MAAINRNRKFTRIKKALIKKTTPSRKQTAVIKRTRASRIRSKRISPAKFIRVKHYDFSANTPFQFDPQKIKTDVFKKGKSAPRNLEISLEPKENGHIVFHPTPGFTNLQENLGQLSVRAILFNKGTKPVDLDKVVLEYKKGNRTIRKNVYLPSDQLIIDPWYAWAWQNGRPYHENGDVLFMNAPFPQASS